MFVKHVGFRILLQNFIKIICVNSVMHSDKRQIYCIMKVDSPDKCVLSILYLSKFDLKAIN